jgi:hypothetical protein
MMFRINEPIISAKNQNDTKLDIVYNEAKYGEAADCL